MRPETLAVISPARAGAVLVALAILWRIIHVNAGLYDEGGRPRLEPPRAVGIAEEPQERAMLASLLADNPARIEALLLTARGFERDARFAQAAKAYDAAYRLAPLDREVLRSGSAFFLRQGNVDEALALMDRLVEHYPDTRERAFPAMAEMLASGRHAAAWDRVLAREPAWIGAFLVSSCRNGVDPSVLVPLFMSRVAAAKAQPEETACLVDGLRRAERWDEAYQVWLNTLPRERLADVGAVFNGSFEFPSANAGFDWILTRQAERDVGHSVDVTRAIAAAGTRALKVSYNGKRQAGIPISQFLFLAPGRYEVSGLARPEGMRVGRGVQWTVRCVKEGVAGPILAQSERFTGSSEWRRFAFELAVPAPCRGQVLQLEPAGSEESAAYLTGAAWFDDLAARRMP